MMAGEAGKAAARKEGQMPKRALGIFKSWSMTRLRQTSWSSRKLRSSEDFSEKNLTEEPESLSSESYAEDASYPEPRKGSEQGDQASGKKRNALLLLAAAIFLLGHFEMVLRAAMSLSLPMLSTIAAAAFLTAALWSEAVKRWRRRTGQLRWACRQAATLVAELISAILKLPNCAQDINLVLHEIREVNFELKVIRSKIRFLPGQPKDANGVVIEPFPRLSQ